MKGGGETEKENYFVIRWLLEDGSQHARLLDVCEYGRLHRLLFGEPRLGERLMIAEVDRFLNHVRDHNLKFLEGSLESVKVLEYRITRRNCVPATVFLCRKSCLSTEILLNWGALTGSTWEPEWPRMASTKREVAGSEKKNYRRRNMKKKTLGFKLVCGGIISVLIPLLVVGLFASLKAAGALETLALHQSTEISKNLVHMTELAVAEEMKIASQLSSRIRLLRRLPHMQKELVAPRSKKQSRRSQRS